jgi:deoxyribodipyrimidine photo-lyase
LDEVNAALLIGDENPCREPERWRKVLARRLKLSYWTVDADVVVPSTVFGRDYFLLQHMRPHLKAALPKFLVAPHSPKPQYAWLKPKSLTSDSLASDITAGFRNLDRTIQPVDTFAGGTHAALKHLKHFITHGLQDYPDKRNHPELQGTSRLSPYLHFGNIGPLTIALAVEEAYAKGHVSDAARERFLEQVIAWRELSVLFVKHNPSYDSWECAEPWARQTLIEHTADTRPYRYTLQQLERAETHDDLWNAAQREMTQTGWMHNYMRMYWAKMILAWSPDPARAYEWAVTLRTRRPRPQWLCRHRLVHRWQARPPLVQSPNLRPRATDVGRIHFEEIRFRRLYSSKQGQSRPASLNTLFVALERCSGYHISLAQAPS